MFLRKLSSIDGTNLQLTKPQLCLERALVGMTRQLHSTHNMSLGQDKTPTINSVGEVLLLFFLNFEKRHFNIYQLASFDSVRRLESKQFTFAWRFQHVFQIILTVKPSWYNDSGTITSSNNGTLQVKHKNIHGYADSNPLLLP